MTSRKLLDAFAEPQFIKSSKNHHNIEHNREYLKNFEQKKTEVFIFGYPSWCSNKSTIKDKPQSTFTTQFSQPITLWSKRSCPKTHGKIMLRRVSFCDTLAWLVVTDRKSCVSLPIQLIFPSNWRVRSLSQMHRTRYSVFDMERDRRTPLDHSRLYLEISVFNTTEFQRLRQTHAISTKQMKQTRKVRKSYSQLLSTERNVSGKNLALPFFHFTFKALSPGVKILP